MKLYRRRLLDGVAETTPTPVITYEINVQASPAAAGSVVVKSGTQSGMSLVLDSGASYSISASTGNSGYEFDKWTSNESPATTYTDREKTGLTATKNITWTANYNTVSTDPVLTVKKRPEDASGSVHIGSTDSSVTSSGFTQGSSVNIYALNQSPQYVIQWEHDDEIFPVKLQTYSPYAAYLNVSMPSSSTTYTAYMSNLIVEELVLNVSVCKTTSNRNSTTSQEVYLLNFMFELNGSTEATKRLFYLNDINDGSFNPSTHPEPILYMYKDTPVTSGEFVDVEGGNAGTNTTERGSWYIPTDYFGRPQITLTPLFLPGTMGSSSYQYKPLYKKLNIVWYYGHGRETSNFEDPVSGMIWDSNSDILWYNTSSRIAGSWVNFTNPTNIDNVIIKIPELSTGWFSQFSSML